MSQKKNKLMPRRDLKLFFAFANEGAFHAWKTFLSSELSFVHYFLAPFLHPLHPTGA